MITTWELRPPATIGLKNRLRNEEVDRRCTQLAHRVNAGERNPVRAFSVADLSLAERGRYGLADWQPTKGRR